MLKKRTPQSRLGRIENITIDGAQGIARGTSLASGFAERPIRNLVIEGLRLKMLPENKPDKRATDALVFERVDGLTLRNVEVEWDDRSPEPAWGGALALSDIDRLRLEGFVGDAGGKGVPAVRRERVREAR